MTSKPPGTQAALDYFQTWKNHLASYRDEQAAKEAQVQLNRSEKHSKTSKPLQGIWVVFDDSSLSPIAVFDEKKQATAAIKAGLGSSIKSLPHYHQGSKFSMKKHRELAQ